MKLEYLFTKLIDDNCSSKSKLKNLINTNENISLKENKLVYKDKTFNYGISETKIKETNEISFHVKIEQKDNNDVEALEDLDNAIKEIVERNSFVVTTLWNDVYIHYTSKLYPDICNIENKARKLISLLLTKVGGNNWIKNYIPEKEQIRINKLKEENRKEYKENLFYNLDFIDIDIFLFTPYQLVKDHVAFNEGLRNIKEKTDKEFEKFVKDFENKNNWERFFIDIVGEQSINKDWNSLSEYRNIVAHNKKLTKSDYDKAVGLVKSINKVFDKIESRIDDIKVEEEFSNSFYEVAEQLLNISNQLKSTIDFDSLNVWKNYSQNIINPIAQQYQNALNPLTNGYNSIINDSIGKIFSNENNPYNPIFLVPPKKK